MTDDKINIGVLVAPLDWGLGHCTRCIPIIRHLLLRGCRVVLAAEGAQAILLMQEFPSIQVLPLKGYRISYASSKRFFSLKIVWQIPKILIAIAREKLWLRKIIEIQNIDIVISDNRYGLFSAKTTNILITHQLQVQAPYKWTEKLLLLLLYSFINNFSACWVPDEKGNKNLAGNLSHPSTMPVVPVQYMGILSRLAFNKSLQTLDVDYWAAI